jgi:hypothetical protein
MIIRDLIDFKPESKKTDIGNVLKYFINMIKKRSTVFLLSDFITDKKFDDALKIANRKHDLVALKLYDSIETELPNIGLVPLIDAETNALTWVNTSKKEVREQFKKEAFIKSKELEEIFKKSGVDFTSIATNQDYIKALMQLFRKRGSRR